AHAWRGRPRPARRPPGTPGRRSPACRHPRSTNRRRLPRTAPRDRRPARETRREPPSLPSNPPFDGEAIRSALPTKGGTVVKAVVLWERAPDPGWYARDGDV